MQRRQFIALAMLPAAGFVRAQEKGGMLVYFGTYTTGQKSKGIYVSRFDSGTGALTTPELAAEAASPSFLALHPNRRLLYAVNEISDFNGKKAGGVTAYAIDPQRATLEPLNRQPSGGPGPAHLTVDRQGRNVLVANYGGGSVAVLPIGTDGRLQAPTAVVQHTGSSVDPDRQRAPHAHSITVGPDNRFAYAADLGLDKILIYRYDAARGTLAPGNPPFAQVEPGSGPRHFAFHPQGRFAYVINEMRCTVTAFTHDAASGGLTAIQTISTLPEGQSVQKGFSTAEVQVHTSGRFLYGSNRGHDTIAVFAIDQKTGRLTLLQHQPTQGSTPRNFGIDPAGTFLLAANQRSDNVVVFRIDSATGRLTPAGHRIEVWAPVCVRFV